MSLPAVKRGWPPATSPHPPLLSPWENHSDFGLVHPSGCGVCQPYMEHVAAASYSTTQPSFQLALEARNHKRDDDFYDGIAEGRRRQKADDRERWEDLEKYRHERDVARDELDIVKAELEIARGTVEHLRRECDHLVARVATVTSTVTSNSAAAAATVIHEAAPPPPPEETATVPHTATSEKSFSAAVARPPKSGGSTAPSALTLTRPVVSYAAVASTQLPSPPTSAPMAHPTAGSPVPLATPSTTAERQQQQPSSSASSSLPSSSTPGPAKPVRHLQHLQTLCSAAHQPGNHAALARVKTLCTAAHATPKERKTEAQRWLLNNWRTPAWERATAANASSTNTAAAAAMTTTTTTTTTTTPHTAASTSRMNHVTTGGGSNNGPIPTTNLSSLALHPPRLDSPIEAWVAYLSIHPTSWPRGVRKDARGKPVHDDVKASRIVARLRPLAGSGSAGGNGGGGGNGVGGSGLGATAGSGASTGSGRNATSSRSSDAVVPAAINPRNTFTALAVRLFADVSLYPTLLAQHGLCVAPQVRYARLEWDNGSGGAVAGQQQQELTLVDVVRHFAACGITEEEGAQMTGWAQEYLRGGGGG